MTDSDIVADILAGYANDPWFAEEANIAKEDLRCESGAYFKGAALAVPNITDVRAGILQELHDSKYAGHVGIHRTLFNVKRIYWWPDMARHIREYVQGCDVCQRNKNLQRQPAGKLMPLPIPTEAWEVVSMNRITHLPKTEKGHTAIFVVVDKFTKMCHLALCKDTDDAEATAVLFKDNCFRFHGWPSKVISDRGPEFTNKFAAALMKSLGTEHCKSISYHPQSNGQTERIDRMLEDMLTADCARTITPVEICSSYRCAVMQHQSTAALVKAEQLLDYSVLLCKNRLTAGLCHCNYTCGDLLFTQLCSDATPKHCSTGQGRTSLHSCMKSKSPQV